MRILFYNHTEKVSGAERVLLMLCENLDRSRHEVMASCPGGDLALQLRSLSVPVAEIGTVRARFTWRIDRTAVYLISLLKAAQSLRKVIVDNNPDLVHANSVRAGIITSLATIGLRVRVLWHIHDILNRHPFSVAVRALAALRGVTAVVAVSKATARAFSGTLLRRLPGRAPVHVIYNGIESSRFFPDAGDRQRKREELGLAPDDIACGIIGQISVRKGQLELIKAFAPVAQKYPRATLFIAGAPLFAGAPIYLRELHEAVASLKLQARVRFLGHCPDTPSLLRALDLVVVNSHSEPCCLVVPEALASGTPVLGVSVDGIPELISEGETGFLTRPRDPGQLSERLIELIADGERRRRVAGRGRAHGIANFGVERFARDFENLYHALESAGGKPEPDALLLSNS